MRCGNLISILTFLLLSLSVRAQQSEGLIAADFRSYGLYEKGAWKELLGYGDSCIREGYDFLLLRLRMGQAAFQLGNYSRSLRHYEAVLKQEPANPTADYQAALCRNYLNQRELADADMRFGSTVLSPKQKSALALTSAGAEFSYKATTVTSRGDGLYARVELGTRIMNGLHMQQALALYNQTIAEPKLTAVTDNGNIAINQREYYNRITGNINRNWQAVAAYHYLYTPFNNFIYNNHIGLAGIRFNNHYYTAQADIIFGKMIDTALQQVNATVSWYPFGNLNLYGISTASLCSRAQNSSFNFRQVIGAKVLPRLWLEGNLTLGSFRYYFERDALYVYNAIDRTLIKAGASAYYSLGPRITISGTYGIEQKELYQTVFRFYNHSITGALTWKF
jgi:tetratricopeptide (TPR) repeat protein